MVRARILLVVAGLIGSLACGSSTTPTGPGGPTSPSTPTTTGPTLTSMAGVWTLVTVNGNAVPAVVGQVGSDRVEIVSDALTLTATGTFTENGQVRLTTGGRTQTDPVAETGTFTIDGNTVNFVGTGGVRRTATVNGNTMTIPVEGNAWVLRKG
jgi:hypothetical protein